jgi:hypothetical protein
MHSLILSEKLDVERKSHFVFYCGYLPTNCDHYALCRSISLAIGVRTEAERPAMVHVNSVATLSQGLNIYVGNGASEVPRFATALESESIR